MRSHCRTCLLAWVIAASVHAAPAGDGLNAQYWANTLLMGSPVFSQIEENVNNFWYYCSPDPSVPPGSFSARYTGWVLPSTSEPYTFSVKASDGARLWVNGAQLINQWANRATAADFDSTSVNLTAGVSVPVTLEYYDVSTGPAADTIQLRWSSPSLYVANGNKQVIIPRTALFSGQSPAATPTPRTALSNALNCLSPPSITLDGSFTEAAWSPSGWLPLTKTTYGGVLGTETAFYQSRWDASNLYLAVSITTGGSALTTDSGTYLYEDPAIEVLFDMTNNKAATLSVSHFQFILRAADQAVTERLNRSTFARAVSVIPGSGYNAEMSFPWTTFSLSNPTPFPAPALGVTYGFDLAVNFDRNTGCRDGQLIWNGKFKNSSDAGAYGNLALFACQSPTVTRTPTPTRTPTRTATATLTSTPSDSPTLTPTESHTSSHTDTETPSPTFSETFTPELTATYSDTATETRTDTPSETPTASPTPTLTYSSTDTPTGTFTPSASPSPSPTHTLTPSITRTMTSTATGTPTASETGTITPSATLSATTTQTSTLSATGTPTASLSLTPSASLTPTVTMSLTATSTRTHTYTLTSSRTLTVTPSHTRAATDTRTLTHSTTRTPTTSLTPVPSATRTPTASLSQTPSVSLTPTQTASATASRTPSASPTPTGTPSGMPTWSPTPERPFPDPFVPGRPPDDHVTFPLPPSHGPVQLMISGLDRRERWRSWFPSGSVVAWYGTDSRGVIVPSGIYVYFLLVDNRIQRGTVTVLR